MTLRHVHLYYLFLSCSFPKSFLHSKWWRKFRGESSLLSEFLCYSLHSRFQVGFCKGLLRGILETILLHASRAISVYCTFMYMSPMCWGGVVRLLVSFYVTFVLGLTYSIISELLVFIAVNIAGECVFALMIFFFSARVLDSRVVNLPALFVCSCTIFLSLFSFPLC